MSDVVGLGVEDEEVLDVVVEVVSVDVVDYLAWGDEVELGDGFSGESQAVAVSDGWEGGVVVVEPGDVARLGAKVVEGSAVSVSLDLDGFAAMVASGGDVGVGFFGGVDVVSVEGFVDCCLGDVKGGGYFGDGDELGFVEVDDVGFFGFADFSFSQGAAPFERKFIWALNLR